MVITLHYYEGLTMKSIAKILQIQNPGISDPFQDIDGNALALGN
jgi:DNA-binding transcriptional regulator LsrR (DeoR family)